MDFQFYMPVRVVFGDNGRERLAQLVKPPVLVVSTEMLTQLGTTERIVTACGGAEVYDRVEANPTLSTVEAIAAVIREHGVATVVALGGGSSMDAAKAAASFAKQPELLRECLYNGAAVPQREVQLIAVPTTAGTGSEVTNVAVLSDPERGRKTPLVSHNLWADTALVMPELTVTVPPSVTASTGFDAFIHALESYWATSTQPASRALALQAMKIICQSLQQAYDNGQDRAAREAMMRGSLLAGMAFSQTRTTVLHAASFPLTETYHLDHGRACAINMIPVMRYVHAQQPTLLTEPAAACGYGSAEAWIDALEELMRHCRMPMRLCEAGVTEADIPQLARTTLQAAIALLTPAPINEEVLCSLFEQNLH